jgi:hypothetical protein
MRRSLCSTGLALSVFVLAATVVAQTYTPQSPVGLSVSFTTEKAGGTRILFFGDVRNASNTPAKHVTLLAEGLDENGRPVSRARGYVLGTVPSRGSSPFEIRMSASGSERRFRVQVESFEFEVGGN